MFGQRVDIFKAIKTYTSSKFTGIQSLPSQPP